MRRDPDTRGAGFMLRVRIFALAAAMLASAPGIVRAQAGDGSGFAFEVDRSGATASHRSPWRGAPQVHRTPGALVMHDAPSSGPDAAKPGTKSRTPAVWPVTPQPAEIRAAGSPAEVRAAGRPGAMRRAARRSHPGRRKSAGRSSLPETWDGHRRVGDAFYVERDGILLWADTREPVNWWTLLEPLP